MVSAIGLLQIETKKDKAKSHLKSQKKSLAMKKPKGWTSLFDGELMIGTYSTEAIVDHTAVIVDHTEVSHSTLGEAAAGWFSDGDLGDKLHRGWMALNRNWVFVPLLPPLASVWECFELPAGHHLYHLEEFIYR